VNPALKIEGLIEAQMALRKAGGTPADAKAMNKQVVDKIIVPEAERQVPVRSGDLKASIDSDATATFGYILAGNRGDVAYAGVIHFGWSTRGLGGGLGGTVKERRSALSGALERSSSRKLTTRATNKAARYAAPRAGGKGRVRGGPIAPQPFIYDAIDGRASEVLKAYEDQLETRFELEGLL
jgi:hypothetical protein